MKSVFALYLMVCVAYAQEPEPEMGTSLEPSPDMETTTPTPSPTPTPPPTTPTPSSPTPTPPPPTTPTPSSPTPTPPPTPTANSTTTTTPPPKHTYTVAAPVANVSTFANLGSLETKLTNKIKESSSTSSNADVKVEVTALVSKTVYGGFSEEIDQDSADDVADANHKMFDELVPLKYITVNGFNSTKARRLQNTCPCNAIVETTIPKTLTVSGYDPVTLTQLVQSQSNAQALTDQIKALPAPKSINKATFQSTLVEAPSVKVQMKTTVTGQNNAPATGSVTSGIADVLGVDASAITVAVVSSDVVTTTAAEEQEGNDRAPIAPMMTIWAVLYVFAMC